VGEDTEKQLRISEERYRLLAEHFNDVVWTMSVDGRITYVSPTVQRMRGISPKEAMRQPLEEIQPPESAAVTAAYFAELAAKLEAGETPEPFRGELEYYRKDGPTVWTEVQVVPHLDEDGQVVEIIGLTRDISGRKESEEQIRRLNDELEGRVKQRTAQLEATSRELEQFIYSAAHDLRAPLRAIDGFSLLVAEDASDRLTHADVEHLQRVRLAAQRMGLLIDSLQALARSATHDVHPERVDVTALAESILGELQADGIEHVAHLDVQPGLVAEADPALLRIVLSNLLENAWKFTAGRPGARIEVGARDHDGERAFYVRDNGAGFSPGLAERIFGMFQRGHTAEEFPGEGVGLATVQRLVAKHGGRVWADGEVDRGACISFTLPEGDTTRV